MKKITTIIASAAAACLMLGMVSCQNQKSESEKKADQMKEDVEQVTDDIKDGVEDAADEVQDAIDDAAEKAEENK